MAITITGGTGNDKFLFESDGTNLTYTNAADGSVKTAPNYGSAYLDFSQGSNDTLYFDGTGSVSVSTLRGAKSVTFVGGGLDDGEKNVAALSGTYLRSVDILGNSDGLTLSGASGIGTVYTGADVAISLSSVKGAVELGSNRDSSNYYKVGEVSDASLIISGKNAHSTINTISGGVASVVGTSGSDTEVDLLADGKLYVQNSIGSNLTLSIDSVSGGSLDAFVVSGTGNTIEIDEMSGGSGNIKLNDGTSTQLRLEDGITGGNLTVESENGDYVRLSSGTRTSWYAFTASYSSGNLGVYNNDESIKAAGIGGNVKFKGGTGRYIDIDRIDLSLDKDGKVLETTSTVNGAGIVLYDSGSFADDIKIGSLKDDATFKFIDTTDSYDMLVVKESSSFRAKAYNSYQTMLNLNANNAPLNIVGEVQGNSCASVVGSAYADYIKLDNTTSTKETSVTGGSGNDVFDFTGYTEGSVRIWDFGFQTGSGAPSALENNTDVFVVSSFDADELAKFKVSSSELVYDDRIYFPSIGISSTYNTNNYYINLAAKGNTADTRCYQITSSGLVQVGENKGSLIAATGWTPQTITAVGGRDTLDGGTNAGVNDTLVSAGKYRNTTFALHKGGGDNVAQNFDFGAEKGRSDVVAVDTSYSTFKLITPESGKVMIGSESEGSLTLEGTEAQNEFIYDYGGNIGIVSVDMSDSGKYMKFVKEANFHIGQGKSTSLIFTSADSIESGVAGNQKGLGWATPYISEGLGTIDASAGHVGAVLGSNDLDQTIIVSKSKDFDEVWGGGGLDEGFSNGTNDTIVGSGNGNTVYYVGHKMGNDVLQNATAGDKVVFIDTKTTDIASFTGTSKEFTATFTNGATVKLSAAEDITSSNTITVQFDDVTYNWNGSGLTAKS